MTCLSLQQIKTREVSFCEPGKGEQPDHPLVLASDVMKLWESEDTGSHFLMLSFSQIKDATDNFSTENKLGEGGFGPVYKVNCVLQFSFVNMLASISRQNGTDYNNLL